MNKAVEAYIGEHRRLQHIINYLQQSKDRLSTIPNDRLVNKIEVVRQKLIHIQEDLMEEKDILDSILNASQETDDLEDETRDHFKD